MRFLNWPPEKAVLRVGVLMIGLSVALAFGVRAHFFRMGDGGGAPPGP